MVTTSITKEFIVKDQKAYERLNKQPKEHAKTIVQLPGSVQWRLVVQAKTPTECIKLVE